MAARRRTNKQEVRDDAETAKRRAFEGVPGLLMQVNLAPQTCSLRVYQGREIPTTALVDPFGTTVTPPAEAYALGRLLEDSFGEQQLGFFLRNAAGLIDGPRTHPRTFASAYNYFFSISHLEALRGKRGEQMSGRWAAIALAARSLRNWTGGIVGMSERSLLDSRWDRLFGSDVAALAEDLELGAVQPGSERLLATMRGLVLHGPKKPPGPKPSSTSRKARILSILDAKRGQTVPVVDVILEYQTQFKDLLTPEQVRLAMKGVPDVSRGGDPEAWLRLD